MYCFEVANEYMISWHFHQIGLLVIWILLLAESVTPSDQEKLAQPYTFFVLWQPTLHDNLFGPEVVVSIWLNVELLHMSLDDNDVYSQ